MTITENKMTGDEAERRVRALLERALPGEVYKPIVDRGIDIHCSFKSPFAPAHPMFFLGQIKAGKSYVQDCKQHWKVRITRQTDRQHLAEWRTCPTPVVLFVVPPEDNGKVYWQFIDRNSGSTTFFVSKARYVSPATAFDLSTRFNSDLLQKSLCVDARSLLSPSLSEPFRKTARERYYDILQKSRGRARAVFNPVLGPVALSWAGWRHITRHNRRQSIISRSFAFLPVLEDVLRMPCEYVAMRRIADRQMTNGGCAVRNHILGANVRVRTGGELHIHYVIRETIRYPSDWETCDQLWNKIDRFVTFESMFEKLHKAKV